MRSLYESIFSVPNDPNKAGKNIQDAMGVVFTLQALGVHDNYIDTIKGDCAIKDGVLRYNPNHDTRLILSPKRDVKDQLEACGVNGIDAVGVELYITRTTPDTLAVLNDKNFCKNIHGSSVFLIEYRDISNINVDGNPNINISSNVPVGARNLNVNCNTLTINAPMALSGISGRVWNGIEVNLDKRHGPNTERIFEEIFKVSYKDFKKKWYYNEILKIPSDILSNPFCDIKHIKTPRIIVRFYLNDGHQIIFVAQEKDFIKYNLRFIEGGEEDANKRLTHYRRFHELADIDGWHCMVYAER